MSTSWRQTWKEKQTIYQNIQDSRIDNPLASQHPTVEGTDEQALLKYDGLRIKNEQWATGPVITLIYRSCASFSQGSYWVSRLSDLGSGIIILCRVYGIQPVEEPIMKPSSFQFGSCRYAPIKLPVPT